MKKILISICLFTVWITSYSQINCNGTSASTVNPTDKLAICNGNLQRTVTASQLVDAAIDTTKVGRIAQGRGSTPFILYFNGTAWVKNDTAYATKASLGNYVPKTGTNGMTGHFRTPITSNFSTGIQMQYSGLSIDATHSVDGRTYFGITRQGYNIFSEDYANPANNRSITQFVGEDFKIWGAPIVGDRVFRTSDSLRYVQLKDAQERFAPTSGTQSTALADGKIWIGDGTNTAFPRTLSGDVTMNNLGVFTIASINGITKNYYDPTSSIQTQLNSKQATISLTTTGAIGAATYSNPTINVPRGYDELSTLGTLLSYSGTQWNSSASWNTTNAGGGTYTFGSNKLALSGSVGSTTFTSWIFNTSNLGSSATYVSNLETHGFSCILKPTTTPSATTYGMSVGIISQGSQTKNDFVIKVGMTSSDFGVLYIYTRADVASGFVLASTTTSGFSSGAVNDVFVLNVKIIKRSISATLTCTSASTAANVGKSTYAQVTSTNGNSYAYGFYQHGGTTDITNLSVSSNVPVGAEYLFLGNSIATGASAVNINNRFIDQMAKVCKGRFVVQSGAGNTTLDLYSTMTQTINLNAKYIFIEIGTNDVGFGYSKATFLSNYNLIISALQGAGYVLGINLFIYAIPPRNDDVTGKIPIWNKSLDSLYTSAYIDINTPLADPSNANNINPLYDGGDQLHPNTLCHQVIGNITISKLPSIFIQKDVSRPNYLEMPWVRTLTNAYSLSTQTLVPSTTALYSGINTQTNFKNISTLGSGFVGSGTFVVSNFTGSNSAAAIGGAYFQGRQGGTGTLTTAFGSISEVLLNTTATTTNIYGSIASIASNANNSTPTNTNVIYAEVPKNFSGNIGGTNLALLRLQDPTAANTLYALQNINYPTGTYTNKWGLYADGGNHTFAGNSKVGIGTTTPVHRLDLTSTTLGLGIRNYNTSTLGTSSGGIYFAQSPIATAADQRQGNYAAGGYDGTNSFISARMQMWSSQSQTFGSAQGGYITFETTPTGSAIIAERMRIGNDGNVGIGVTVPTSYLHLAASTTAKASLTINSGTKPTSPVDGDIWNNSSTNSLEARVNGIDLTLGAVVGKTTLVAGTKAITITGLTTGGKAIVTRNSQGGTITTTVVYEAVCTTNTLTINAEVAAGTVNTSDTSVISYVVYP
jgi:lysophospholipase L1-like esterase